MKIQVKVIPQAKRNCVKPQENGLKIYLTAPAVEGKANTALIEILAEYYHVKKGHIDITKGLQSRHKTIIINGI